MQQYAAEATAASDRAQTIAAKHPNDSIVQQSASIAKEISDLAQKIVAQKMKENEIIQEIIRGM